MGHSDTTFRNYNKFQAAIYAQSRRSYPDKLYITIISPHAATGGRFVTLLDIGCGHGNATRDLAPSFSTVIGVDPSPEMKNTARQIGGRTKPDRMIKYAVGAAEEFSHLTEAEGGVDLLIAATAVRPTGFSMPKFWAEAANIIRPRGTVALWTCASLSCHPSTQNADEVRTRLIAKGSRYSSRTNSPEIRYLLISTTLPLPWSVDPAVTVFPASDFVRVESERDGIPSDGKSFFIGKDTTVDELEQSLGTASMVTRWREANPT
ncbi:S-adenosyl-L-methionine-dependent methyltransferase [Aspergillus alliaceus]|uniref:S-adenosyl-L-methionine-dependent methyltransferase n=1 Tax=Petromyces alliaceus TaxID=209559 RepID=A0A5N7CAP5_PETAA|nr:S-adenosyl-L-methionine-dependent methyltransferase [Aspergillus alliaceus]